MSVHGRSFLQYYNEDDSVWVPIPTGDLVSVEYTDKIYEPTSVEIIISNKNMNRPLGTGLDASAGTYTVEGTAQATAIGVTNPTFRRFQKIRLLHMPRPLTPIAVVHDNEDDTQATFTLVAHGLSVGDYVQIVNESSGSIEDDLYKVDTVADVNNFTLDQRGTDASSQTYATSLPGGGPTATTLTGTHNSAVTSLTVASTTGIIAGDHIKIDDEIIQVTTVASSTVLNPVVRARFNTTAATHDSDPEAVTKVYPAFINYRSDFALYPYFYGRIDTIDVSYSDAVGKTIHIQASDYLRNLQNEPVTKGILISTSSSQAFNESRMEVGKSSDETVTTDQGKFRNARYTNRKLSDTVKEITEDWTSGDEASAVYTDNAYNAAGTTIGEQKFEDSSHVYHQNDPTRIKTFYDRDVKALGAMKEVAMTDIHSNNGFDSRVSGNDPSDIRYGTDGSLVTAGTADVLINENAHGYENGNLVGLLNHDPTTATDGSSSVAPTAITTGVYIVHTATTNYYKIKTLDGTVIQSVANTAASAIDTQPTPTGALGYDFWLDAGLYGANTLTSNTHRPHLNYFMRGTRPIDPGTTGLSAIYPTEENLEGSDTAFGAKGYNQTKVFILDNFDHGLYEEDLFTQVALQAVNSDGTASDVNSLGHKMEMLQVNSMSDSDWVANLSTGHQTHSGSLYGNALFHWNRADDARAYGWYSLASSSAAIDSILEVNNLNFDFFADTATIVTAGILGQTTNHRSPNTFSSQGTFGAVAADALGGWRGDHVTGMGGYSNRPKGGRPLTMSPTEPSSGNENGYKGDAQGDDFHDVNGVDQSHANEDDKDLSEVLDMGAEGVAPANLIKDIYWCEVEGLLGTEVAATQNKSSSALTITPDSSAKHGLETGTIIKITDINGTTSGTVGGIKVNTAPTRSGGVNSNTTDNGSYFRVVWLSATTFRLTACQKHKSAIDDSGDLIGISTTSGSGVFKYKPVFNIFKEACRVQWQSGSDWTTKEEDVVLRTETGGKGAQQILISDVVRNDRPYMGMEVNTLVAGAHLPGQDFTDGTAHPLHHYDSGTTEATSYFGYSTVAFSLEDDFFGGGLTPATRANVDRYGTNSDDDIQVRFRYGDYVSETRFLYGDSALTGVVGRDRSADAGGAVTTSNDVFKTVKCKVLKRFSDHASISKTFVYPYNVSAEAPDTVRQSVANILQRVIIPAQRTTFKIFGYPTIKFVGVAQSGSSGSSLVTPLAWKSYGGRAGMLVEKTDATDGITKDATLVSAINATTDVVTAPIRGILGLANDSWTNTGPVTYFRAFVYSRAGSSIRVVHPAAGVTGNMIITALKYSERAGTASTLISTTGYDEALINFKFTGLGNLRKGISATGNTAKPDELTPQDYIQNIWQTQYDNYPTIPPIIPGALGTSI